MSSGVQRFVWLCEHGEWDDKTPVHIFGAINTARAVHPDLVKTSDIIWENDKQSDYKVTLIRMPIIRKAYRAKW